LPRSTVNLKVLLPKNTVKTKALRDFPYQSENGLRKSHIKDLPGEFDSFWAQAERNYQQLHLWLKWNLMKWTP